MSTKYLKQQSTFSLKRAALFGLFTISCVAAPALHASQLSFEDDEWVEEAADVALAIKIYDSNSDGQLNNYEIQQGAQIDIQNHDTNGDGKLNIQEYRQYSDTFMDKISEIEFREMDSNGSNDLSVDEIISNYHQTESRIFTKRCLNAVSSKDESRLDALGELNELDNDRNQRLSLEEFNLSTELFAREDFLEMDTNRDGQISNAEFQGGLKDLAAEALLIKRNSPLDC